MSTIPPPPPPVPNPDLIPPSQAKDPMLVLIVGLFLGGIAYFVYGQWQKGIAAIAAWVCLLGLAIVTCGLGMLLLIPFHLAVVVDAYFQAKLLQEGKPIGQWTFFQNHL